MALGDETSAVKAVVDGKLFATPITFPGQRLRCAAVAELKGVAKLTGCEDGVGGVGWRNLKPVSCFWASLGGSSLSGGYGLGGCLEDKKESSDHFMLGLTLYS